MTNTNDIKHDFYFPICYVKTDTKLIEYPTYYYKKMEFRGEEPNLNKEFIACLGSAHTFGRYIERPFPDLLQDNLNMQVLNLGRPAGQPYLCCTENNLLDLVNKSKLCIIQVFSARFSNNSEVRYIGHNHFEYNGTEIPTMEYWKGKLSKYNNNAEKMIQESIETYIKDMKELFDKIKVPKILFWFSKRKPGSLFDPKQKHKSKSNKFYGSFPQLVDNNTILKLKDYVDAYVEVCSSKGLPSKFIKDGKPVELTYTFRERYIKTDKLANQPKTINSYYPSQEMHGLAASKLLPVCRELLDE